MKTKVLSKTQSCFKHLTIAINSVKDYVTLKDNKIYKQLKNISTLILFHYQETLIMPMCDEIIGKFVLSLKVCLNHLLSLFHCTLVISVFLFVLFF
jgi:hypothetical protein